MAHTRTNANGEFSLDGTESEIGNIDPWLKIYHDCIDRVILGIVSSDMRVFLLARVVQRTLFSLVNGNGSGRSRKSSSTRLKASTLVLGIWN